jgi:hypothetical protein
MATTPNFNWSTPDNTGLVKNGALDIRTLGNSIDASMADLKGGTTGQVLAKATNTDMDFTWVAQDDSNAIQNAIVDAKGDIIAATANDTPARLAVGTNGQVLTADSTAATGIKWATPASGGTTFIGCSLYKSSNQNASNGVSTSVTFESELFDTNGFHDNSTNNTRITIPTGYAGKYLITGVIQWGSNSSGTRVNDIKLNGTTFLGYSYMDAGGYQSCAVTMVQDLAVGDYIEMIGYQNSGSTLTMGGGGRGESYFAVSYIGA